MAEFQQEFFGHHLEVKRDANVGFNRKRFAISARDKNGVLSFDKWRRLMKDDGDWSNEEWLASEFADIHGLAQEGANARVFGAGGFSVYGNRVYGDINGDNRELLLSVLEKSAGDKFLAWSQYQGGRNRLMQLRDDDLFFMSPDEIANGRAALDSMDDNAIKAEYDRRKRKAIAVKHIEGGAAVVRAAKLSGQAFLVPVEGAVAGLLTNSVKRNRFAVATSNILRISANMGRVFAEDVGRLDAPKEMKRKLTTDVLEGNIALMMAKQADTTKYADDLRAATWGHKGGRLMATNTAKDAMELSVVRTSKDNVLMEAAQYAKMGLSLTDMQTHIDPSIRAFSRLRLGSVSENAWGKFVRNSGNLWLLRNDDYAAYVEVNGAISQYGRRGSGIGTDLQDAAKPYYKQRKHFQGSLANTATMFTNVVSNLTGTMFDRWRQNELEGIDNVSWQTAQIFGTLIFYAGATQYIRGNLLQNKDLDPREWTDDQWARFGTQTLAYSTFGGIVSDFASILGSAGYIRRLGIRGGLT